MCVGSLPRQPTRRAAMDRGGRGSHRCAGACAPVPSPDLQRYKAASLLERRRCPDPNGIYEPYRCTSHRSRGLRGPPERSVMHDRGKRRGSARWPWVRCEGRAAPQGLGRRVLRRPSVRSEAVPRVGGCPRPVRPSPAPKQRPQCEAAPSLGARARATLRAPPRPCIDAGAQSGARAARQQRQACANPCGRRRA